MKGQNIINGILVIAFSLVTLVVVSAVLDDVVTTSSQTYVIAKNSLDSNNEFNMSSGTHTLYYCGNGLTTSSLTCYNSTTASAAILASSYNVSALDCVLSSNVAMNGAAGYIWNCSYEYAGESTYSSGLSRTIVSYLVPIILLGALALAVGFIYIRFVR